MKIVNEQAVKSVASKESETIKIVESATVPESKVPVEKDGPKKEKSSFRSFLYGSVFTVIAGYFFVYQQIWKSARQMEQSLADISVDITEKLDLLDESTTDIENRFKKYAPDVYDEFCCPH